MSVAVVITQGPSRQLLNQSVTFSTQRLLTATRPPISTKTYCNSVNLVSTLGKVPVNELLFTRSTVSALRADKPVESVPDSPLEFR